MEAGAFSTEKAGDGSLGQEAPLHFKDIKSHTDHRVVEAHGEGVIQAEADASASGLIRKVSIDPEEYPIV